MQRLDEGINICQTNSFGFDASCDIFKKLDQHQHQNGLKGLEEDFDDDVRHINAISNKMSDQDNHTVI